MEKKRKSPEFWRYAAFLVVLFGIFIWLTSGLVRLQLTQSEELLEKAQDTRTKTIALRGKRGNITTSDSVLMAEDRSIYNVSFQKDASANSKELYKRYTASILETIDIVEKNGGTIDVSFVIRRKPELQMREVEDENGEKHEELYDPNPDVKVGDWEFHFGAGVSESVLETRQKQWRSNNYLTSLSKYEKPEQCIEALKKRYQLEDDIDEETGRCKYEHTHVCLDFKCDYYSTYFLDCRLMMEDGQLRKAKELGLL